MAWFCFAVNIFILDKGRCDNPFVLGRGHSVNIFVLDICRYINLFVAHLNVHFSNLISQSQPPNQSTLLTVSVLLRGRYVILVCVPSACKVFSSDRRKLGRCVTGWVI